MGTKNRPGKFDCYAKADPDEPMFVLLGRDPTAGVVVTLWAALRERVGYDEPDVNEEAMQCAALMREWARFFGKGDKVRDAQEAVDELLSAWAMMRSVDQSAGEDFAGLIESLTEAAYQEGRLHAVEEQQSVPNRPTTKAAAYAAKVMTAKATLATAYAEQLDEVGKILVRAGFITEKDIGRHGVQFAVRNRFEPVPTEEMGTKA